MTVERIFSEDRTRWATRYAGGWSVFSKADGLLQDGLDRHAATELVLHNPTTLCLHPMRFDTQCLMEKGHSGRHSSVVFRCDGCNKVRRSKPVVSNEDIALCFMCVDSKQAASQRED